MIRTALAPKESASKAACTLGAIPSANPDLIDSSSTAEIIFISESLSGQFRYIPATSVITIKADAPKDAAIAAAAKSAFTFKPVFRSSLDETGATTGTIPWSINSRSADGFTRWTLPTSPRSAGVPSIKCVRLSAMTVGNVRADIACAFIPALPRVAATSVPT